MDAHHPATRRRRTLRSRYPDLQTGLKVLPESSPGKPSPPPLTGIVSDQRPNPRPDGPQAHAGGDIKLFGVIKYAVGLFLALWMLLYWEHHYIGLVESLVFHPSRTLCTFPLVHGSSFCQSNMPPAPGPEPLVAKVLAQQAELASLQMLGASRGVLTSQLIHGESNFQYVVMIVLGDEAAVPILTHMIAVSSRAKSLLGSSLVGLTLKFPTWNSKAERGLESLMIAGRGSPPFWITERLVGHAHLDYKLGVNFEQLAGRTYDDTGEVLALSQATVDAIVDLKTFVDTILSSLVETSASVPKPMVFWKRSQAVPVLNAASQGSFDQSSTWRALLQPYRAKHGKSWQDFDRMPELCAQFYATIQNAEKVFRTITRGLQQAHAELEVLKEERPVFTDWTSVNLTVKSIRATSARSEESRKAAEDHESALEKAYDAIRKQSKG